MPWVNAAMHFKNNKNKYIEFTNKTVNVCRLLNNRRYEPLIGLIYDILSAKEPNLPQRCPIRKVCVYYFDLIVIF